MNDNVWYLYQNKQQVGPFDVGQIQQLFNNKMISQNAYVFKVGWKDWRPIEEVYEELDIGQNEPKLSEEALANRRSGAPRATISGRVVVHNNGQLTIGNGVNISTTGMFVESHDQIFTVGEEIKLSVKAEGLTQAFNVVAKVIRFNSDPRFPIGYGLRFENLEDMVRQEIDQLVTQQNVGKENDAVNN